MSLNRVLPALACLTFACDPSGASGTGGVELPEEFGPSGQSCGRGLAVTLSDYVSTNVALVDLSGRTASSSFISSSSSAPLLDAALGGDVVLPSTRAGSELVLLDRSPASILTFVDWQTAEVRGQLDVGQSFAANPQDYLELDAHRALVSRNAKNPDPDASALERGDDLLLVDPSRLAIVGSIDLSAARSPGFLVRPSALLRVGSSVLLSVSGHDAGFEDAAEGSIVILDAKRLVVTSVVPLPDLRNCTGMALSPSGDELAVSCTGYIDDQTNERGPPDSGLVLLAVKEGTDGTLVLEENQRLLASGLERGPFAFSVAYASEDALLFGAFGAIEGEDAGRPDTVLWFDAKSGATSVVLQSEKKAFTLGQIQCVAACEICFVADAGRNVVQAVGVADGKLGAVRDFSIDDGIGLGPRSLGLF